MGREAEIDKMLKELHASYLKDNEHDEGDLIYYRINYRLADTFGMTREEAERLHSGYHVGNPRHISQGFCEKCGSMVTIIPVIYGIQESDMERMKAAEMQGRLIIGDMATVRQGSKVAMFGCKECRTLLSKYGTL
ncbi:hypothetical protein Ngar_c13400 [Candidatus Nitrososphaera gargensis Ga9.2]|uniref:Uncharacterized protein n=1 Tax=Nitrososphaera gargensis (strain Ga9.2) TaxID=1237085 RepID=K0IHB3_NITGG|nr:hypothetical protein [Candidatus Nitrososphaera gargensis]AFU58278.1 hypothetical protein Ngar_c13400 [Candidatus Nitrososphaera gargensis Ga9.2]